MQVTLAILKKQIGGETAAREKAEAEVRAEGRRHPRSIHRPAF